MKKKIIALILVLTNSCIQTSPLTDAIDDTNVALAKNIIDNTSLSRDEKDQALLLACEQGTREIAEYLLNKGANANTERDEDGFTPLILAVTNENPDPKLVQALLRHKANVNEPDNSGTTPYMYVLQELENGPLESLKQIKQILKDAGAE
jgi:ankyrin repeat protein